MKTLKCMGLSSLLLIAKWVQHYFWMFQLCNVIRRPLGLHRKGHITSTGNVLPNCKHSKVPILEISPMTVIKCLRTKFCRKLTPIFRKSTPNALEFSSKYSFHSVTLCIWTFHWNTPLHSMHTALHISIGPEEMATLRKVGAEHTQQCHCSLSPPYTAACSCKSFTGAPTPTFLLKAVAWIHTVSLPGWQWDPGCTALLPGLAPASPPRRSARRAGPRPLPAARRPSAWETS